MKPKSISFISDQLHYYLEDLAEPCDEMIMRCSFEGYARKCSDLFHPQVCIEMDVSAMKMSFTHDSDHGRGTVLFLQYHAGGSLVQERGGQGGCPLHSTWCKDLIQNTSNRYSYSHRRSPLTRRWMKNGVTGIWMVDLTLQCSWALNPTATATAAPRLIVMQKVKRKM